MSFKTELNAIKKQYVKLMKLPVNDMLPALTEASVITDGQREKMIAMALDKDRASYLLDDVIIASLKCDNRDLFDSFLQVLEEDENPLVKKLCEDLKSYLEPQSSTAQPPQMLQGQPPQLPYDQPLQKQYSYPPQGQYFYGQPPQGQVPYGQPPQGQFLYGQPPQGQFSYGQAPQGQFLYGQAPQGQFSYGQSPQGQFPYGQPPQGQFSYQRQFSYPSEGQFSPRGQFSPHYNGQTSQGESSPFQRQFSWPTQGQYTYEQPSQGQFSYGQPPNVQTQQQSHGEPLQVEPQASSSQFIDNLQPSIPQDQPQPQPQSLPYASCQQDHQPSANATIPSESPSLQMNPADDSPPQNLSEGNIHQQNYPQQTENAKSEPSINDLEVTEVQQNHTIYPPQEDVSEIPTNQPSEEQPSHTSYPSQDKVVDVHTNDELQKEIPQVLQSRPSQEEIIDVCHSPTDDETQKEIPKVLQSRSSQEEIIDVRHSPTDDQTQKEIPKVLQSRPPQEEIIDVRHSPTDDQKQKEIPKVLQSRPPQEEIIDVRHSPTDDQKQKEIPKVLQSHSSQEEIIDVHHSPTDDQTQKEIPKVLQSRPSQEEIVDVRHSPTDDQTQKEIPKVLQSRPSQEEIVDVHHSPTDDQTQKEIPKVLQSRPSQEEIIDVCHSPTDDQTQKEIPKVLQSRSSQEEIIDVCHSPTDDQTQEEIPKVLQSHDWIIDVHQKPTNEPKKEIPKVLPSPADYPSQKKIADTQAPCHDNEIQPSPLSHQLEVNSSANLPQQTLQAGTDTTEPVQRKKMPQGKDTDNMQAIRWIECMKSVCKIEGKCKGTGVIGHLTMEGNLQYVLLTCHHVIPTEDDAKSACLYFGYTDNTKNPLPCNASNILDTSGRWFWSDPTYRDPVKKKYGLNYSMMKVKKSALDNITYPGMSRLMNIQGVQLDCEDVHIEVDDHLALMAHVPHLSVTYGNCTLNPSTAVVKYDMASVQGSAGGPVFKQEAGKPPYIVAIHNGYAETKNHGVNIYVDYGVRLLEIINHCTGKHSLPMPPSGFTYKQE